MWKIYTQSAIRRNKSMGIAAFIAVLIASTFLSLVCGFAYTTWTDAARRAGGASVDAGPVAPFIALALVVGLSVIWILSSAFSVSMQARVRHMGILASVGATPRQQRTALVQEVLALSLSAVLAGILLGVGLTWGIVQYSNAIAREIQTDRIRFEYHWLIFFLALAFCVASVWLSAMWCARKLARLSPLEAIRGGGDVTVKKMRGFRITGLLFGVEGSLARKSLYARRRVFRTSVLSLTLSVLVFSTFLNVMTLSDISTEQTYFERYKDTWDLRMVTEAANDATLLPEIRELPGVTGCIANQKAMAAVFLTEDMLSGALVDLGGLGALQDTDIVPGEGGYWVQAPLIILDDESFASYCADLGVTVPAQSAIAINKIWDNQNSHYREPAYVDYLGEDPPEEIPLYTQIQGAKAAELCIGAYAAELPPIREEHQNFSLTMVMDYSTSQATIPTLLASETCYTIRTDSEADTEIVQASLQEMETDTPFEIENRITEAAYNVSARRALYQIIGVLCGMLALIGLANVFSNTLGSLYQRRREFARYMSVGLTPRGVKKVFFFEGLMVGLQPVLLSLPVTMVLLALFLTASHLPLSAYLSRMPILPLAAFIALLCAFIALAYALGYHTLVLKGDIVNALKDDTTL